MNHSHGMHHHHQPGGDTAESLNRLAFTATAHCFTGCAIGEVLGLALATALGWSDVSTIITAVGLAFLTGYAFTLVPLLKTGIRFRTAASLALAADTVSMAVMETVDNSVMLMIPGAMQAGLTEALFWGSLAGSLLVAFVAAYPINRWLIQRGRGHAAVHQHHGHTHRTPSPHTTVPCAE